MSESLYDVLGVEPTASESEIKGAWRSLVTVLGPTDHRFSSINEAASVLLDTDKRAAYDAGLVTAAPEEAAPEVAAPETAAPETAAPETLDVPGAEEESPAPIEEPDEAQPGGEADAEQVVSEPPSASAAPVAPLTRSASIMERLAAPTVVAAAAIVAVALIVGTSIAYLVGDDSSSSTSQRTVTISLTDTNLKPIKQQVTTLESADVAAALQAATVAAPQALSYDYRTLAKDEAAGKAVMTADYAAKSFTPYFEGLVKANAPRLKQVVVCGQALDVGVVRTAPNLVEVLLLIDRFATNSAGSGVSQDFADITMVKQNGTWLISNFATAPIAK